MVKGQAKIVIVMGSKGGVGATEFTVRLSSELGENVLIVDMDMNCTGDVARSFDRVDQAKSLADIRDKIKLAPSMIESYLRFGSIGLIGVQSGDDPIPVLKKLSKIYSNIIIDSGSAIDDRIKQIFAIARQLILVSRTDQSSIFAVVKKIRSLKRMGLDINRLDVVVNGSKSDETLVKMAIQEKLGLEVKVHSFDAAMKIASIRSDKAEKTLLPHIDTDEPDDSPVVQDNISAKILDKLSSTKEIKKLITEGDINQKNRAFLEQKITEAVNDILDKDLDSRIRDRSSIIKEVIDEAIGLGPLEKFMADPKITEIMVNALDEIYIERDGRLNKVDARFITYKNLMAIVERIVAPIGRRIDESSPVVDARLSDGSRVHIIIPPLSLKGPTITIRKFNKSVFSIDDLVSLGSISSEMADFLKLSVEKRVNILVSGGTGSGKTTMLNLLSSFIPPDERIVTIEDSAELKLGQPHVVRLESRPPNIEGRGEVNIRDLVKASLRMRPDRIIVGECRGAEALDMLQAMNTGHDGSLTTIHSNSCRDSIARLETLVLFAGFDLPVKAIREQIASAIDLIIQIKRQKDGSRKVVSISELTGLEGQTITMHELFSFKDSGFQSTGFRPEFLDN